MRVLVCGRDAERAHLFAQLDAIHAVTPIEVIIEGGDGGAHTLAASWARVRGVSSWRVPADERRDGRNAFMIRDARMIEMCKPELVLAFPGEREMVTLALACRIEVRLPAEPGADPNQVSLLELAA